MIECLVKLICGRYIRFDCSNRSKAKSLKTYYEKFNPDSRACTLMENYKKEDWLVNIPLYMIEEIANLLCTFIKLKVSELLSSYDIIFSYLYLLLLS